MLEQQKYDGYAGGLVMSHSDYLILITTVTTLY